MQITRIALLCVAGLLLSGCRTMDDNAFVPTERTPSIMDSDAEYVAYVERVARRRGIQVMWVNAPRRRVDTAQVQ